MTTSTDFQAILSKLSGSSWAASKETVGGVPCMVLTRRVERRPEDPSDDNSEDGNGPFRDNLPEKVVISASQEASFTKQTDVRP